MGEEIRRDRRARPRYWVDERTLRRLRLRGWRYSYRRDGYVLPIIGERFGPVYCDQTRWGLHNAYLPATTAVLELEPSMKQPLHAETHETWPSFA